MRKQPDTRPAWLKAWRKLRDAGVVRAAFPTPQWIAEWERLSRERGGDRP